MSKSSVGGIRRNCGKVDRNAQPQNGELGGLTSGAVPLAQPLGHQYSALMGLRVAAVAAGDLFGDIFARDLELNRLANRAPVSIEGP
jgi:hypothetical protein